MLTSLRTDLHAVRVGRFVLTGVMLRRFIRVVFSVQMMGMGEVRMVASLFVIACLMVRGGFMMMLSGMLVVLSRVFMMFGCFGV